MFLKSVYILELGRPDGRFVYPPISDVCIICASLILFSSVEIILHHLMRVPCRQQSGNFVFEQSGEWFRIVKIIIIENEIMTTRTGDSACSHNAFVKSVIYWVNGRMNEVGAHLADERAIGIHLPDCRESDSSTCPATPVSTFMVSYNIFQHVSFVSECFICISHFCALGLHHTVGWEYSKWLMVTWKSFWQLYTDLSTL